MTDINPFPISISLDELDEVKVKDGEEPWSKYATIFKTNGKVGVKKTIAFTHDSDVACAVDYDDESEYLPEGTGKLLETRNCQSTTTTPTQDSLLPFFSNLPSPSVSPPLLCRPS